jgi:hypothetical protein
MRRPGQCRGTSLLISTGDQATATAQLCVVAQLDDETVRALRSPANAPITIGSTVTTLASPGPDQPLDLAILHRALDHLAPPRVTEPHGLIATGIKVIDVFCPLQVGMRVTLCGARQVGTAGCKGTGSRSAPRSGRRGIRGAALRSSDGYSANT